MDKLYDFDYLLQNFYVVDATTSIDQSLLNVKKLLKEDLTIDTNGDGPKILIYHTHSQEGYADSTGTDESQTVVGVGSYLTEILENEYGIEVLHHKGQYDVDGREHAYSTAAPYIEQILEENPSIEVVIDLHRDGVGSATRLVTTMDGKQVAQVMFFNGLSYTTGQGSISYLKNPYIQQNLAFSLQLKIDAVQEYPGFTRPIYLKGYRYNMHFLPRSLLVEVGAQTNTIEEAKNAMPYLAKLLNDVLCEQE
jgi:stage II sporulation protein P